MLVVDVNHWLDQDGSLPTEDKKLRRRVLRIVRLIEYGGPLERHQTRETLVECRRRPLGKPCVGFLWVVKTERDNIHAYCPVCDHEEASISGWQHTIWAYGAMPPVNLAEIDRASRFEQEELN